MDEALNNQNSNSNDSMPVTMSSFYESVLRKVTHVFKNKSSDGVKQLEDLWESISAMRQQHNNQLQTTSSSVLVDPSSSSLKRDASKMTTSTSSPSMTQAKKPKLTTPTVSTATPTTNTGINKSTKATNGTSTSNNSNGKVVVSTTNKQPKATTTTASTNNNTRKEVSPSSLVDEITVFSSSMSAAMMPSTRATTTSPLNSDTRQQDDQIYDLNSVVDDVSCFTCKKFNQESSNKLVECRKCTKWFHQQCHSPRIDESQIESADSDDKSLLSVSGYFSQCQMCRQQQQHEASQVSTQTGDNNSKPSIVKQNSDESKSEINPSGGVLNGGGGVKGLAALANKFNSVPPKMSSQQSNEDVSLSVSSAKTNQDDLFKKFKQATTTMGTPSSSVASKKQLNNGITNNSTSSSSSSCSMSSTAGVKKSVFNLNSNTLPLKSPNHLIATSTKK